MELTAACFPNPVVCGQNFVCRSVVTCSILRWISNIEQAVKLEVEALHRFLRVTETDEKDSDNLPWKLLI